MSEFTVCLVQENKCSIDSARHMLVRLKRWGGIIFFFKQNLEFYFILILFLFSFLVQTISGMYNSRIKNSQISHPRFK